jgi:hypothetical protein
MQYDMKHAFLVLVILLAVVGAAGASGVSEEEAFSSTGIDTVSVRAQFLDVEVRAEDGLAVSMNADLPTESIFESRGYHLVHEVVGSRLNVWIEKDGPFAAMKRGGKISLQVPHFASVKVETTSGRITAKGIETRSFGAKSISGRIRLEDIRGVLDASSVSGRIMIDSVEGRVTAKTVSGAIEARRLSLTEDSTFSTVSGDVGVGLDAGTDGLRFDLTSLSGRIVVGNIKAIRGLRMGTGGALVRAHSVSGSLSFQ